MSSDQLEVKQQKEKKKGSPASWPRPVVEAAYTSQRKHKLNAYPGYMVNLRLARETWQKSDPKIKILKLLLEVGGEAWPSIVMSAPRRQKKVELKFKGSCGHNVSAPYLSLMAAEVHERLKAPSSQPDSPSSVP